MDMNGMGAGMLFGGALGSVGGMVLGAVTKCWHHVASGLWRLLSYIFVTVDLRDEQIAKALLGYFLQNYKRTKSAMPAYGSAYDHIKTKKYGMVSYECLGDINLTFWNGWLPLFYRVHQPDAPKSVNNNQQQVFQPQPPKKRSLFFIRGTFNVDKIITDATNDRNELSWDMAEKQKIRRFFIKYVPNPEDTKQETRYSAGTNLAWHQEPIYRLLSHESKDIGLGQPGKKKALDLLIFPQRIKDLINEIIIWRKNHEFYVERGLPWKRGWLLYGPPGTGKTAIVRAFAEDLDMPMFVFALGEMQNKELQKSWEDLQAHTPCVALFEDIDNVFHGRRNIFNDGSEAEIVMAALTNKDKKQGGSSAADAPDDKKIGAKFGRLSFDCLLNCLDGVNKTDGVFVVITTNHVENIDPAIGRPQTNDNGVTEFISTRPGRIDKAIELTYMLNSDKIELAKRILLDCDEGLQKITEFVKNNPSIKETPAQFQERCAQVALAYFWRSQCSDGNTSEQMIRSALTVHVPQPEDDAAA